MSSGGTWVTQNKQRPGAYINFVAVPNTTSSIGDRGTVICALPMTWGAAGELITVTGADLITGDSTVKIGCAASDTEESLPYRTALAGCSTALLFRSDTGGVKATAVIEDTTLTATAKYAGTTGNYLSIVIAEATVGHTVQVLFKYVVKETFTVETLQDFEAIVSDWVDFTVIGETTVVPVTAGIALTDGANGTVETTTYEDFFEAAGGASWQTLAINTSDAAVAPTIVSFIDLMREKRGKKVQGVVYDYPDADTEGIISVDQGYMTEVDTVGVDLFPLYVASITAGADVNESNTARVVTGATTIINPINEEDINDALSAGKFLLSYRQDGAVCVETDINTLHTFTVDKGYAFSKNRVMRCLDEIGNTVAYTFNRNFCGKIDNDAIGRNLYKNSLISIFNTLVGLGAITNFEGASDITVYAGEAVDSVVVDLTIQPVDSMEKLYMTVNVDA